MSFSEKMRESLGAEGLRLEVRPPTASIPAGTPLKATVAMIGGTKDAHVDAVTVRVVEADRHWLEQSGTRVSEEEAQGLEDRRHLTAGWERRTIAERRVSVARDVVSGAQEEVEVEIDLPAECKATSVSCAHMLNVQADIKGQIDPTGNARVVVRAG